MNKTVTNDRGATVDALALLLEQTAKGKRIIYGEYHRAPGEMGVELNGHPFCLELRNPAHGVTFLGKLGATKTSVNALAAHLGARISEMNSTENLKRLRITQIPEPSVGPGAYELFFEVDLGWFGTLICDGCNTFSGEGGDGSRRLGALFNLLSLVTGLEVEIVTVNEEIGAMGKEAIQLAYSAHYES